MTLAMSTSTGKRIWLVIRVASLAVIILSLAWLYVVWVPGEPLNERHFEPSITFLVGLAGYLGETRSSSLNSGKSPSENHAPINLVTGTSRPNGRRAPIIVAICSVAAVYLRHDFIPFVEPVPGSLAVLLRGNAWVGYDPSSFDPARNPNPAIDSMAADLEKVKAAGFTGIVTFSSKGRFSSLPRLAKARGLKVIMGVWDITDGQELDAAIREREFIDAYCVGHNGLNIRYSIENLRAAIAYVRRLGRRPVSTTEENHMYVENSELVALGDWLFPDIHVVYTESRAFFSPADLEGRGIGVREALIASRRYTSEIAKIAVRVRRPLLVKSVLFPTFGAFGASVPAQQEFFADFSEWCSSPTSGLPIKVGLVAHSAFNAPWKRYRPYYTWDPYTGLLDWRGSPNPAVGEIVGRFGDPK